MTSLSRFFSGLIPKANPANRVILSLGISQGPTWTNHTYTALAKAGYITNTDVYACVNHIARAIKGIEWLTYDGPQKKKLITEDTPLKKLLRQPNPQMGGAEFREAYIGYLMLSGNSFIYRAMGGKTVQEMWPLRSDRMNMIPGNWKNPIGGYKYKVGFDEQDFKPDQFGQTVMHTKLFNPIDDWRGLSPLQNAARCVDQSNDIQAWNVALMQNSATPSGAFVSDDELGPVQKEDLRREIDEKMTGSANARRPLLLDGGMKWQAMGLMPTDLDWLEGDERCSRKISAVYGVPPELLGVMSKGGLNDANFSQARLKFYMETVLPLMDHVLDDLNKWLFPIFGEWIAYDPDDVDAIQTGREIIHERARKNFQMGVMTLNESRHLIGLPAYKPSDDPGNVILIPSQCRILGQDPPPANPNSPRKPGDTGTIAPGASKFEQSVEFFKQLTDGREDVTQ